MFGENFKSLRLLINETSIKTMTQIIMFTLFIFVDSIGVLTLKQIGSFKRKIILRDLATTII